MDTHDLTGRIQFLRDAEQLKDTLRSGFTGKGRVESVADHTWRLTLMSIVFADKLGGIELLRLLKICVIHDLGEAIDGDIPAPEQTTAAPKSDKERNDFRSLISSLPRESQEEFLELWDDYENARSPEAVLAKALDKLETLMQHNQGSNPDGFDYEFNLSYGKSCTDATPLTAAIRAVRFYGTPQRGGFCVGEIPCKLMDRCEAEIAAAKTLIKLIPQEKQSARGKICFGL